MITLWGGGIIRSRVSIRVANMFPPLTRCRLKQMMQWTCSNYPILSPNLITMQSVVAPCHTVWANCECRRMGLNNLRGWCSASRPSWGCRGIIDTEMSFHQMGCRAEFAHGCRYGVPKEFGNAGELSSSVFLKHDCNNNVLQVS